jgi:hypothetical protein
MRNRREITTQSLRHLLHLQPTNSQYFSLCVVRTSKVYPYQSTRVKSHQKMATPSPVPLNCRTLRQCTEEDKTLSGNHQISSSPLHLTHWLYRRSVDFASFLLIHSSAAAIGPNLQRQLCHVPPAISSALTCMSAFPRLLCPLEFHGIVGVTLRNQ